MKTPSTVRHQQNGHASLEERVASLETEVNRLKAASATTKSTGGWRAVAGSHAGSETFQAICREVERLRKQDYARAQGQPKRRRTKRTAATAKG